MPRYELHCHTSECDLAAHASAAELVRLYHAAGYSGMVITDHYFPIFFQPHLLSYQILLYLLELSY